MYAVAMSRRIEARQSGRKGGRRLFPKGVRIEVRCVPKLRASFRGKSGGVSGEGRSLSVKSLQGGGDNGLGSRERRTFAGNCMMPG